MPYRSRRGLIRGLAAVATVGCRGAVGPALTSGGANGGVERDAAQASRPIMSAKMDHVLVVGGTGMLRAVAVELARRGHSTSVIARGEGKLRRMADESGGRIYPLAVDYRNGDALAVALRGAVASRGPFKLVVAWIHSSAPEAPLSVARIAAESGVPVRYVHVLGSAADDPSAPGLERRGAFAAVAGITYEEVVLGFIREAHGSRWLSNEEIATGVLAAIDRPAPRTIVGTTRPWSARP